MAVLRSFNRSVYLRGVVMIFLCLLELETLSLKSFDYVLPNVRRTNFFILNFSHMIAKDTNVRYPDVVSLALDDDNDKVSY